MPRRESIDMAKNLRGERMMMPRVKPARVLRRLSFIAAIVVPCWLSGTVVAEGQSPLEQQRKAHPGGVALAGRVVSVHEGVIYTSITANWTAAGLTDGSVVRVQLAGRNFNARFLSPGHYSQVLTDPVARRSLDVDLACTVNRDGALAVIGLSGGLPEWLGVKSGWPVSIVKQ